IRAILPVFKTTPLPSLHRESGIPPAFQLLECARIRQALRLRSLDEFHPLRQRATELAHTRLTQLANLLPGLYESEFARNIVIFTDNKTAAAVCQGHIPISSQARALRIRQLQENWPIRDRLPHVTQGAIVAKWIPGHSGITG
ncbi:reverse transcriptase, putative, partial [Golovinomyces cichoracearum]